MIVRNEAAVLPRLVDSIAGQIDYWTIVDTGSTDDSVEAAPRLFGGIDGQLIEDKWRGYGPARNVALDSAAPHTEWLLTLDADETVHGTVRDSPLESGLDGIVAEQRTGQFRHWVPRLIRSDAGWRWYGRAHEFLQLASGTATVAPTESFYVEHHRDGGNREAKFERELALLEEDWKEQPGDSRTAFYLARTHDDIGDLDKAIEWYKLRLSLGGWAEESFFARLALGGCLLRSGAIDEGCGALWRAWGERPWRAEPLVALAEQYRNLGAWDLAWHVCTLAFEHCGARPDGKKTNDVLDTIFVDSAAADWQAAYQASICAWYVEEKERALDLIRYLLGRDDLPDEVRIAVESNRSFYLCG